MNKIPVTFMHDGKECSGTLDEVAGAGSGVWHLMVDNYYWGRLRRVGDQWHFDESNKGVGRLKEYFADVVRAWYQ